MTNILSFLRILMENIYKTCSLASKLCLITICSIRILNILEVIVKTVFSKIAKCSTQVQVTVLELEKFGEKSELGSFTRHLRQEIGIKINHAEALEMIQALRGVKTIFFFWKVVKAVFENKVSTVLS